MLQDDRELVAAEAGDSVLGTHDGQKTRCDLAEELITGGMTVLVVDALEPIEIDVEEAERR